MTPAWFECKEMPQAKMTSKGQITLPKPVRDALGLMTGDRVAFIEDAGGFRLVPANRDVRELRGMFHRPGRKPVSVEEMKATVRRRAA
jgi:AbrB family looped-hinge helix DNA binding protein